MTELAKHNKVFTDYESDIHDAYKKLENELDTARRAMVTMIGEHRKEMDSKDARINELENEIKKMKLVRNMKEYDTNYKAFNL